MEGRPSSDSRRAVGEEEQEKERGKTYLSRYSWPWLSSWNIEHVSVLLSDFLLFFSLLLHSFSISDANSFAMVGCKGAHYVAGIVVISFAFLVVWLSDVRVSVRGYVCKSCSIVCLLHYHFISFFLYLFFSNMFSFLLFFFCFIIIIT